MFDLLASDIARGLCVFCLVRLLLSYFFIAGELNSNRKLGQAVHTLLFLHYIAGANTQSHTHTHGMDSHARARARARAHVHKNTLRHYVVFIVVYFVGDIVRFGSLHRRCG